MPGSLNQSLQRTRRLRGGCMSQALDGVTLNTLVRRCATNEALPTTTVFASSCQGSLVLGELVALLLRLGVPSLEQWTWAAWVARTAAADKECKHKC